MTSGTLLIIGLGFTTLISVMGFMKLFRSNKTIQILLVITVLIGMIGIYFRTNLTELPHGNAADSLWGPFVYIALYGILRYLYIQIYKREPTYNKSSWYDPEDGRRQNWLDVAVYIIPMISSIGIPIIIHEMIK